MSKNYSSITAAYCSMHGLVGVTYLNYLGLQTFGYFTRDTIKEMEYNGVTILRRSAA